MALVKIHQVFKKDPAYQPEENYYRLNYAYIIVAQVCRFMWSTFWECNALFPWMNLQVIFLEMANIWLIGIFVSNMLLAFLLYRIN